MPIDNLEDKNMVRNPIPGITDRKLFAAIFVFVVTSFNLIQATKTSEKDVKDLFDFIVVGAGASGCVVARRLSENNYTVLLIEKGTYPHPDYDIPAKSAGLLYNSTNLKFYTTVPQINVITYPTGEALGGGTAVNGMVYNRGRPLDYDNWAKLIGDSSWSYQNLLPYFKRIEDYAGGFPSNSQHGTGGPIAVTQPIYAPGLKTWLEAGKDLGYTIADTNGPQVIGFAPLEFSRRHGRRVSAFHGYVKPLLETGIPNFKLLTNAKVRKVIFVGKKAVGVEYMLGSKLLKAFVKMEVILSAGVLSSPSILLKSGIGPNNELEISKLPKLLNLPVGKNLHDHILVQLDFTASKEATEVFLPKRDLNLQTFQIYEETGDGPFSSFIGMHAQAFLVSRVRSQEKSPNPYWPDICLHLMQTPTFGFTNENSNETSFSVSLMITRPKSRGQLSLDPNDPFDGEPLIDFKYISHPDDMEAMIDGVKQVLKIFEETIPYKKEEVKYPTTPISQCKSHEFRSDDYWRCYISHKATSCAHAAGTCKMGRSSGDPEAVVDSKMRVVGIKNLRVADTSVMPVVTNANTQVPAYIIGEKVVEAILEDWNFFVQKFKNYMTP